MPTSKAQQKAVNKYMRENYDRINLTVPKGKKDEIKAHAQDQGESVNAFINRAIDEAMQRDKEKESPENTENILFRVQAGEKEPINAHAAKMGESLNGFILRAICETIERDLN